MTAATMAGLRWRMSMPAVALVSTPSTTSPAPSAALSHSALLLSTPLVTLYTPLPRLTHGLK